MPICAVRSSWCHCATRKAVSPRKARCLTHRGVVRGSGEVWGGSVLRYFAALEDGINLLPGFAPELQGVYVEECDGRKQVRCYVIKQPAAQPSLLKGEKL